MKAYGKGCVDGCGHGRGYAYEKGHRKERLWELIWEDLFFFLLQDACPALTRDTVNLLTFVLASLRSLNHSLHKTMMPCPFEQCAMNVRVLMYRVSFG